MGTTKEEIAKWFQIGASSGSTHMLVVCDTFDWDDFPIYVEKHQDVQKIVEKYENEDMYKVMEVYDLSMPAWRQINAVRAWNLGQAGTYQRKGTQSDLATGSVQIFHGITAADEPHQFWDYEREGKVYMSCAVVAVGLGGEVVLLDHFGPAIDWHVEAYGSLAEELGLDFDEEPGIYVWEGGMGSVKIETIDGTDWDHKVSGGLRAPTDQEWEAIRKGECPWTRETLPRWKKT